jgi:hypothetical protein
MALGVSERMRGRVWPGTVSPEARYWATVQAWTGSVLALLLLATGIFVVVIPLRANQSCECVTYAASETVRSSPSGPVYDVLSTGGHHYLFEQDPGLHSGQPFTLVFRRNGHYQMALVNNQPFASKSTFVNPGPGSGFTRYFLFGQGVVLLMFASLFLAFGMWGLQARRALDRDREAPVDTVSGRYEGSRLPRLALASLGRAYGPFARSGSSGFPILITGSGGERVWLAAPLDRARDVKTFETALRETDHFVEAKVHPHTRVVASLRGRGDLVLDLESTQAVDPFDRAAGIPLGRKRGPRE